jgi:hypothetical protein
MLPAWHLGEVHMQIDLLGSSHRVTACRAWWSTMRSLMLHHLQ